MINSGVFIKQVLMKIKRKPAAGNVAFNFLINSLQNLKIYLLC
jgi:hypothetical protein